ncbi:MAG: response regulator [Clostridia bacterium]|nr:response regulator [Clostridia bacterium]
MQVLLQILPYMMVYSGSALMAFNIFLYVRFARRMRGSVHWSKERRILNFPIILLILFLAGYLAVGVFGRPDLIMGGILFGGSIFVFVMLRLIESTVARIQESEHLQAKLVAAEEASRSKTFFLSNMSHDLRTPLNAIIGYTALAKKETAPERKQEYVIKIETAGRQLLEIVNSVLEMSRIESGKLYLEPILSDLEECVREAGDLVREQMEEKRIHFSCSSRVQDPWVLCDKKLLNRVLMNLLSNAGKFTGEEGSVTLTLKQLGREGDTGSYEFSIKDTGIGMDPAFVEHLFTPFEREQTSTISKIQGTGLGMAIAKNIIDLMGGTCDVITEKGKGTEFIIRLSLPIREPEASKTDGSEEIRFDGCRVLLAEDNPINMEIAQIVLTQAGFEVETAENGRQAVDKLLSAGSGAFKLILMDIQMPVMDGYTAVRTIRALPDPDLRRIPVIAMTANAFADDVNAAYDAGMNAHISKPLDVSAMLKTIRDVLEQEATERKDQ